MDICVYKAWQSNFPIKRSSWCVAKRGSGVLLHLPHRHGSVQSEGQGIRFGGRTRKIFAGTLSHGGSITTGLCRDAWCTIGFSWIFFMPRQQPTGYIFWVSRNMKLWIRKYNDLEFRHHQHVLSLDLVLIAVLSLYNINLALIYQLKSPPLTSRIFHSYVSFL